MTAIRQLVMPMCAIYKKNFHPIQRIFERVRGRERDRETGRSREKERDRILRFTGFLRSFLIFYRLLGANGTRFMYV